jgi:cytochrome d ubiquinol oxidase subunit II
LVLALLLGGLAGLPLTLHAGRGGWAFLLSSAAICAHLGLVGLSLYPALVPAAVDGGVALTIAGASSSERTLTTMLIIAAVGMPLVLAYTAFIYRTFRGKVVLDEHSY